MAESVRRRRVRGSRVSRGRRKPGVSEQRRFGPRLGLLVWRSSLAVRGVFDQTVSVLKNQWQMFLLTSKPGMVVWFYFRFHTFVQTHWIAFWFCMFSIFAFFHHFSLAFSLLIHQKLLEQFFYPILQCKKRKRMQNCDFIEVIYVLCEFGFVFRVALPSLFQALVPIFLMFSLSLLIILIEKVRLGAVWHRRWRERLRVQGRFRGEIDWCPCLQTGQLGRERSTCCST